MIRLKTQSSRKGRKRRWITGEIFRKKKKIIYDSMGDNESEEEDEGNVINPETNIILIFDLEFIGTFKLDVG